VSYSLQPHISHLILKDDYDWFLQHTSELYHTYGKSCLAIKNHMVLGSYNNIAEAVRETKKTEIPGTFVVVEIGDLWRRFNIDPHECRKIKEIKGLYTNEC